MAWAWKIVSALRRALPESLGDSLIRKIDQILLRLPPRTALSLLYWKAHRRWPDFDNPRTMSEKVCAMRLADPPFEQYGDKLRVKDWVAERIGEDHVIPTLYSGKSLPPRAERNWPLPYVIKTNNGCRGHIFVREEPDWDEIERAVDAAMSRDYGKETGEYYYSRIDPMIMVEPFVGGAKFPLEYKFFMFSGECGMILVISDREDPDGERQTYFRPDFSLWQRHVSRDIDPDVLDPPPQLDKMIELAKILSNDFAFVRADFYLVDGQSLFSELTFFSAGGLLRIEPQEDDLLLGNLWDWSKPFVDERR